MKKSRKRNPLRRSLRRLRPRTPVLQAANLLKKKSQKLLLLQNRPPRVMRMVTKSDHRPKTIFKFDS